MAKVFLCNKLRDEDDVIDRRLAILRETYAELDDTVTSGRDFHKACQEDGTFEGWPQWNYTVSQEFSVFVTGDQTIGKATHDQLERALTEGKEVYWIDEERGELIKVVGLRVLTKADGGSWKDYANIELGE